MRKTLIIAAVLSLFATASTAFAQGFVPLAPIPGLTDSTTATGIINSQSFANFFNNLYKFCIGLSAALAVIMIIWGGLEISTQDSISKQSDGKERIRQAIYGLILVLSPVLVFSIINPSILSLELNLTKLDLTCTGGPCIDTSAPASSDTSHICAASETTGCVKPVCSSYRTTNCIPAADATNAVALGLYSTAQSGGYCYSITNCKTSSCVSECGAGGCNFSCGNQTQCQANFSSDPAATGSCQLIP